MNQSKMLKIFIPFLSLFMFICIVISGFLNVGLLIDFHFYKTPTENQVRVACVGDSVTYGYGIMGWLKNSYPQKLNDYLGTRYCVNNYGYSSRTASAASSLPYTSTDVYQKSKQYLPDVVVLMLGTNDSKDEVWTTVNDFYESYKQIVKSYKSLSSDVKIILGCPIPVIYGAATDPKDALVKTEIRDTIKRVGDEENLTTIDFYEIFQGREDLYGDGIHPNKQGADLIAQTVYNEIKNIL